MKSRFLSTALIIFLGIALSLPAKAFKAKETYPKIANYYLQPLVPKNHYNDLFFL
jgi:hypothetical protein